MLISRRGIVKSSAGLGAKEEGVEDPTPNPKMCMELLAYARAAFEPASQGILPLDVKPEFIDSGLNSFLG